MLTPAEYLHKNFPIIPCNGKIPKAKAWQKTNFTIDDFHNGDNIGLKLADITDVDIDNVVAHRYIRKYLLPSSAIFGRKSNPNSHILFKGKSKHKKFNLPECFERWFKTCAHGATLIECRSGIDKQSIVPGSKINGEEVKWSIYEGLSPYPADLFKDICKVALATALTILYPPKGSRADWCYAIACILAVHTKWNDEEIDDFVLDLAEVASDEDIRERKGKGTHARKQIINGGRIMMFNTLKNILGLDNALGLYNIFSWVGVKPPSAKLEELKERTLFILDSSSIYDTKTGIEKKKTDFNDANLFYFPGGRKADLAFQSLMKDAEFQERIVIGRAVLPGHDYPIAEIGKDHFYLKAGKYLNLYPGPPIEPVEGDVSDWVDTYKKIYGEKDYEMMEQYLAAMIQKIFKYKLDITEAESKEIGPMKIQWGILNVGPEGTAKKAIGVTLQRIIGREFVDANATYDEMIGNHSEVIYNKLFICINEVVTTGSIETKVQISNKLKPFWTDEDSKINPKHIRPFRYWNNVNGICFSNEKDCLHVVGSRRYCVINQFERLSSKILMGLEEDGTFKKLYDFILSDKIEHLFHYFLHEVKIKDWKVYNRGRAPITDALVAMQDENLHPTVQKLSRALKEHLSPFDDYFPGFIVLDDLLEFIREKWKTQINEKYVKDWLIKHGLKWNNGKQTRQMFVPDTGGRPRAWLLEDDDRLRDLTQTELGTFTDKGYSDNIIGKLKYSFDNDNEGREKILEHLIKTALGDRYSEQLEGTFYEDLLMNLYSKNKEQQKISIRFKTKDATSPGGEKRVDGERLITLMRKIRKASQEDKKKIIREFFKKTKDMFWHLPSNVLYEDEEDKLLEALASNPSETEDDWKREDKIIDRLAEIEKEEEKSK